MKYMLLIYGAEGTIDQAEAEACYHESADYARELHRQGKYLAASPLRPSSTATSIRLRDGKRIVTDGPFAETREQLGGYFIVDAADLDEAIDIAAKVPGLRFGTVEIRPILPIGGLPEEQEATETANA